MKTLDHFERFDRHEYNSVTELVAVAIVQGIIKKSIKDEFISFIESTRERGDYYHPTDIKEHNGTLVVPLTLKSLRGYYEQWEKEKARAAKYQINQIKPTKHKDGPELTDTHIRILFKGLKGYFEPYDIKHFTYAINGGGEPPKGYEKLKWLDKKPISHLVYLNRLLSKGDWSICREFNIYNAKQINNKRFDDDPPPGSEYIKELIDRIKEA